MSIIDVSTDGEIRVSIHESSFTGELSGGIKLIIKKNFQDKQRDVVLDLSRVNYCDSLAIATLYSLRKELMDAGFGIVFEIASKKLINLFRMMHLDDVFTLKIVPEILPD